jgi:hypothetical protein
MIRRVALVVRLWYAESQVKRSGTFRGWEMGRGQLRARGMLAIFRVLVSFSIGAASTLVALTCHADVRCSPGPGVGLSNFNIAHAYLDGVCGSLWGLPRWNGGWLAGGDVAYHTAIFRLSAGLFRSLSAAGIRPMVGFAVGML